MKLTSLLAATAAVIFAGNVAAQATSGSSLNETSGGTYLGALPVGIVATTQLRDALQGLQLDAACIGEDSKACMPSISTVELASLLQAGFGEEWGANYGVEAFTTGAVASTVVCGTIASDEAARVAARHVGIGCSSSNPESAYNSIGALLSLPVTDTASCMSVSDANSVGAIGFATADTQNAAYSFVKLDGQSPDLANFQAGNYAMFADVHGGSLTGAITAQPFGDSGAVALADNPPMHASSGNYSNSNECAAGRLRNGAAAGNLAE